MSNFSTPGVYTEEIPVLPPSVAAISTAIPAFIGLTEKAIKDNKNVMQTAVRIATFLEFKEVFGMAQVAGFEVQIDEEEKVKSIAVSPPDSSLYHELDLYFKNGGGDCYIVSIGTFGEDVSQESFLAGLEAVSKEDEPTLLMLGEATKLADADYYAVCQQALSQCGTLKDRFCILDVKKEDVDAADFRNGIGANNLKYGAAYTPYLQTSLSYHYQDKDVKIFGTSSSDSMEFQTEALKITYSGSELDNPRVKITKGSATSSPSFSFNNTLLTITNVEGKTALEVIEAWAAFSDDKKGFHIISLNDSAMVASTGTTINDLEPIKEGAFTLASIKGTALYSTIVSALSKEKMILPPSAAIAGVYATTDRERGVWKAPANVSLNSVIGPVTKITSADQEKLNVDDKGKSINAIRSFSGRGTMVWGARTLAGNDTEWRYVPVRRLFNMIEESTKKASHFAVFETNDVATWLKVKAMIQSFLYGVWQQGGLAGTTEEQAYFVNIGLGKTMTQQDILEGRMIVEIGLAAARPAEFIILKFAHKLQEV